jgi:hypothetical protein
MINSLDVFKVGQPWPPADQDERDRIAEHQKNRKLYEELHLDIFPKYNAYINDKLHDDKKQYIIIGLAETATTNYMDLLLGEAHEIEAPKVYPSPDEEVFIDVSRDGIGLYEISQDGITAANPETVYLVTDPGNIRKVTAYVFFAEFKEGEKSYVKLTIHEPGSITHKVFWLKDGKLNAEVPLSEFPAFASYQVDEEGKQYPFGKVDNAPMLVVRVDNALSSDRRYGRSDYTPSVHSLIEALDRAFAFRFETLAKFNRPIPVVPETAAPFDHALQRRVFKTENAIITKEGDPPSSYLTWAADLASVEREIDQLMVQLLIKLKLSPVLLDGQGEGHAESGTALRIRLIPTLSKVRKFATALKVAIPQVQSLKSKLDAALGIEGSQAYEPEDVTVHMQDGIPDDPMERAQIRLTKAQAIGTLKAQGVIDGATSLRAAIICKIIPKEALAEMVDDPETESMIAAATGRLREENSMNF